MKQDTTNHQPLTTYPPHRTITMSCCGSKDDGSIANTNDHPSWRFGPQAEESAPNLNFHPDMIMTWKDSGLRTREGGPGNGDEVPDREREGEGGW